MAALSQTAANVVSGTTRNRVTGVAGATITAGMPVYKDLADANKYKPARANAAASAVVAGIALNGAAAGQPVTIQTAGDINLGATLVVGQTYSVSDAVAGEIVPNSDLGSGDYVYNIGVAETASNLILDIQTAGVAKP